MSVALKGDIICSRPGRGLKCKHKRNVTLESYGVQITVCNIKADAIKCAFAGKEVP